MKLTTSIHAITTVSILLIVVASGPLIPAVDFTPSPLDTSEDIDDVNATISVVEFPQEGFRIEYENITNKFELHVEPASVRVDSVVGTPILVYELEVIGLGQNVASITILDEANAGGLLTLEIETRSIDRHRVTEESYEGNLSIRLRTGNDSRTIRHQNVTIPVEGLDDE